jgi:hypothetical protein
LGYDLLRRFIWQRSVEKQLWVCIFKDHGVRTKEKALSTSLFSTRLLLCSYSISLITSAYTYRDEGVDNTTNPKGKKGGNVVFASARWLIGGSPAWPKNKEIFTNFFQNFNR